MSSEEQTGIAGATTVGGSRADIEKWDVEDNAFWETKGKRIAYRNLAISVPALLCAFAVWGMWGIITVQMHNLGFPFIQAELFTLTAIAGIAGATMRIPASFFIRLAGGRNTIFLTTAMLLSPAIGTGIALQHPEWPLWVFQLMALWSGVGGGNFASSMSNINTFFPKRLQGTALGINAGVGNFGVTTMQVVIPLVMTVGNADEVIKQAAIDGIPDKWMEAARNSPVYKMAVEWKVALPLHPGYRTLPMVWYVPPLSPISAAANAGHVGANGEIPDVNQLRIPVKYLANLLTAGDTAPVVRALERMLAMRAFQREKHIERRINTAVLQQVGITQEQVEEMYHVMAIANYEDRFVIPSTHREYAENTFNVRGGYGFSFGNGCSEGTGETSLFGSEKKRTIPIKLEV